VKTAIRELITKLREISLRRFWCENCSYIWLPFFLFVSLSLSGQTGRNDNIVPDTLQLLNPVQPDSLSLTAVPDSLQTQTDTIPQKDKPFIDAEIKYNAKDSTFWGKGKIYLYGEASTSYQDKQLTAHFIELDMEKKQVYACGTKDSMGVETGLPVFKDNSGEYTMREIIYNFESGKAIIKHVVTTQGEGFIIGETAKKNPDNSFIMKDGMYTTCDNNDHPHFYIKLTKAKMIPNEKTITGPAYLVIEDVAIPFLGLPFAYVPASSGYSSGFLMPSYGEETNRGFFLREGGYYFAFNDYFDVSLTGDIYGNLSWGLRGSSNYKKRYKYSGSLNAQYITNITSEKGLPDYGKSNDMSFTWSHRQDTKANPYSTFSASVNYSTSSFDKNNVTSVINPEVLATNTKRSSISYTQRFPTLPVNFSANFLHSQNSRDSTISVTAPNLTVTMNRIFPFKRKNRIGSKEAWYEKISLSYSGTLQNSISTKESELMSQSLVRDWKNGVKHTIPVSMNLKMLKYFTLTPNFSYNERWYSKSVKQDWDTDLNRVVRTDTIQGFHRVYDYNFGVGTSTKLYTMFTPIKAIFGDKLDAIRHVMTPSVNLSYRPDFGQPKYGFYDWYEYYDARTGEIVHRDYSYYEGAVYGIPGSGRSGSLGMSLGNTLEMKVKSDRDTTGFKKISLIEGLNLGASYNFLADSMNLSKISMSGRTKLFNTSISFGASFSPYAMDTVRSLLGSDPSIREIATYRWKSTKGSRAPVRLESANLSFGLNFGADTFKKKDDRKNGESNGSQPLSESAADENGNPLGSANNPIIQEEGDEGYVKFEIPWNVSINYSMRLVNGDFDYTRMTYKHKLTADINVSGQVTLTKKWDLSISSGYNIERKEISHTNLRVSRNLHCWSMSFNMVPVGMYKSFFFSIAINSSMLRDLKYEKRSSPRDNANWN
jgi:lipopolysaccharide assembly outer membrane protein LptD (OstA)